MEPIKEYMLLVGCLPFILITLPTVLVNQIDCDSITVIPIFKATLQICDTLELRQFSDL